MRKPALLQHLMDQGHGDPETAGAAVKIVQVLTGHEVEQTEVDQEGLEWSALEVHHHQQAESTETIGLGDGDQDIGGTVQTIIIPDEMGRPIEIQVISSESTSQQPLEQQQQSSHSATDQLQFELSAESLNVIQAFQLQGGNVDDTLAALM